MRITIASIGRLKDGGERDLFDRYTSRLNKAGRAIGIGPLTITQHKESRAADVSARKDEEAVLLVAACKSADFIFLLDEGGKGMTSIAFAQKLAELRDHGVSEVAFLIGGPDGHGAVARQSARQMLSLGPMTLPHGLARVVLAEQLYRAVTILSGHPYHRD
jgi:23S rRNA (pseudouridine1915-N3)-methyltransferase